MTENRKKYLFEQFESVIEDSKTIRELLNAELTVDQLNIIKTKISNNKTINGACNGILSTVRIFENIEDKENGNKRQ